MNENKCLNNNLLTNRKKAPLKSFFFICLALSKLKNETTIK